MATDGDVEMISQEELNDRVQRAIDQAWQRRVSEEEEARRNAPQVPTGPSADMGGWIQEMFAHISQSNLDSSNLIKEGLIAAVDSTKQRGEKIGIVPSKFKGVKSDAERFLTALQMYIFGNKGIYDNEDKKLALCFSLCEDKAGAWIQPYISKANKGKAIFKDTDSSAADDSDDDGDTFQITTFKDFCKEFEEAWFPTDPKADARNEIEKLKQGSKSVTEYSTDFMMIAAKTGYDKSYLRERFKRGLIYNIRETIAGWDRKMDTLHDLRAAAVKAEQLKEEFTGRTFKTNPSAYEGGRRDSRRDKPFSPNPKRDKSPDYAPMEVDVGTVVCFRCYKKGHVQSECKAPERLPFRRVVYKERAQDNQPKKVAASAKGKEKEEFVQGSSHDEEKAELVEEVKALTKKVEDF